MPFSYSWCAGRSRTTRPGRFLHFGCPLRLPRAWRHQTGVGPAAGRNSVRRVGCGGVRAAQRQPIGRCCLGHTSMPGSARCQAGLVARHRCRAPSTPTLTSVNTATSPRSPCCAAGRHPVPSSTPTAAPWGTPRAGRARGLHAGPRRSRAERASRLHQRQLGFSHQRSRARRKNHVDRDHVGFLKEGILKEHLCRPGARRGPPRPRR